MITRNWNRLGLWNMLLRVFNHKRMGLRLSVTDQKEYTNQHKAVTSAKKDKSSWLIKLQPIFPDTHRLNWKQNQELLNSYTSSCSQTKFGGWKNLWRHLRFYTNWREWSLPRVVTKLTKIVKFVRASSANVMVGAPTRARLCTENATTTSVRALAVQESRFVSWQEMSWISHRGGIQIIGAAQTSGCLIRLSCNTIISHNQSTISCISKKQRSVTTNAILSASLIRITQISMVQKCGGFTKELILMSLKCLAKKFKILFRYYGLVNR